MSCRETVHRGRIISLVPLISIQEYYQVELISKLILPEDVRKNNFPLI